MCRRVLSLELILVLLRNSGPLFKTSPKFVNAVKTFLCNSLLSNCTSSSSQVTGLALQIFVVLVQDFKEHLKAELEVFISSIFIRIIESENSTYDHKARVLEVLHLIFADPRAQLELFVNYDCDLNATNIFSRIVASLARLAKVRSAARRLVLCVASSVLIADSCVALCRVVSCCVAEPGQFQREDVVGGVHLVVLEAPDDRGGPPALDGARRPRDHAAVAAGAREPPGQRRRRAR